MPQKSNDGLADWIRMFNMRPFEAIDPNLIYVDHAFAGKINFFLDFHINLAAYEQLFICIS